MIYDNFTLRAYPRIVESYCTKCHSDLKEVDNGWLSSALFCPKCESVFVLKLVKLPDAKVSPEWRKRAKAQATRALETDRIDRLKSWAQDTLPSGPLEQLKSIIGGSA